VISLKSKYGLLFFKDFIPISLNNAPENIIALTNLHILYLSRFNIDFKYECSKHLHKDMYLWQ
jgi:hypothetical protein